jgi:hypothetical protein
MRVSKDVTSIQFLLSFSFDAFIVQPPMINTVISADRFQLSKFVAIIVTIDKPKMMCRENPKYRPWGLVTKIF